MSSSLLSHEMGGVGEPTKELYFVNLDSSLRIRACVIRAGYTATLLHGIIIIMSMKCLCIKTIHFQFHLQPAHVVPQTYHHVFVNTTFSSRSQSLSQPPGSYRHLQFLICLAYRWLNVSQLLESLRYSHDSIIALFQEIKFLSTLDPFGRPAHYFCCFSSVFAKHRRLIRVKLW